MSRNWKLGGIDKFYGGVNMLEVQIYTKKPLKNEKRGGGCRLPTGVSLPTIGGGVVKISQIPRHILLEIDQPWCTVDQR